MVKYIPDIDEFSSLESGRNKKCRPRVKNRAASNQVAFALFFFQARQSLAQGIQRSLRAIGKM